MIWQKALTQLMRFFRWFGEKLGTAQPNSLQHIKPEKTDMPRYRGTRKQWRREQLRALFRYYRNDNRTAGQSRHFARVTLDRRIAGTTAEPPPSSACTLCGHGRNLHEIEQPYECFAVVAGSGADGGDDRCICPGYENSPRPTPEPPPSGFRTMGGNYTPEAPKCICGIAVLAGHREDCPAGDAPPNDKA